jgi:dihydroxyacetone kinase-like protein|tara:strand:- start:544 stop:1185 length:642 start_codon:yes stop_codon:yes gene_type:complete
MTNFSLFFLCLENIKHSIELHKDEIEKLDQNIGDGDHIFNIQRGLKESLNLKEELKDNQLNEILKKIGIKIMTTVGGSSGALFSTLLINMAKAYNNQLSDQKNIALMFDCGVEAMKKRGKADLGEKTMLDVLVPVSKKLNELSDKKDSKEIAKEIIKTAEIGMLSTKELIATKGRASFLGERSIGHIDPGARSSQIAIEAICNVVLNKLRRKE